ncbi:MAG TPA: hypothetical protein VE487_05715 [Ilumatobacter sp.]|nr:hypothetical protein [Ilumatobacter sp.]
MAVQAWFVQDDMTVRPGTAASLSVVVENVGDRTESYTIIPAGLSAAWTTVTRPNVTLFGGSRDVIEVTVRPPAIPSTSSGPTAVAVRVIPQSNPDDSTVTETIVAVSAFDDRRITVLQPLQRGRRRATYEFMVDNHGNNLASCRLHLIDTSGRVDGSFDPPAVGVAPGSSSLVRLKLRARRGFFRRAERQVDFEIEATEPEHEPATGRATLIQPPTIPARTIGRVALALAGIALVIGAWYWVVRPEIRDAADRAVADRVDQFAPTESTIASTTTTTVPIEQDDPVAVAQTIGEPISYRIAVDVGITQERSESMSVPPDSQFLMTDLVLQNPNGDLGAAQLLRNGDVLYTWDLGAMNSANEFQPRVSPLPFAPSDNIVLAVSCEAAGETSGTGCEVAVLLGGTLVPRTDGG